MSLTALLFGNLGSSVCHWITGNIDDILSVGNSMYLSSLQRGMILDLENLSVNELPGTVRWFADDNEAVVLSTSRSKTNKTFSIEANRRFAGRQFEEIYLIIRRIIG